MEEIYENLKGKFRDFMEFVKMVRGMIDNNMLKYTHDEEHFAIV